MTWKLWRVLQTPPIDHPLYRRHVKHTSFYYVGWVGPVLLLLVGTVLAPTLFFVFLLLMPVLYAITNGTVYGAMWSMHTSSGIVRERQRHTYELLAVSPGGPMEANWALCTATLYRNRTFEHVSGDLHWVIRVLLGLIVLVMLTLLGASSIDYQQRTLALAFSSLVFTGVIYINYVQAVTIACLTGIIVATYTQNIVDARLWSFGGVLLLQCGNYLLAFLLIFPGIQFASDMLRLSGFLTMLLLPILRLALFYLTGESIITGLWMILMTRLGADQSEATQLLNTAAS